MEDIVQRYFDMANNGIENYFDADEIIELLDYFEAIDKREHFKKVVEIGLKQHPHNVDIKIQLCKAHILYDKYEKALKLIEKIGESEDFELKLMKCECLCALDRYNELTTYLELQQNNKDDHLLEMYEFVAHIVHEQCEYEHSFDMIKRGYTLFPDSTLLKEEFCYHLELQGEMEQAIKICESLIDHDPYCTEYWYMKGRLYTIMGSYDKAIETFDFALVCNEKDLEIKILKAFCYYLSGNNRKVAEIYIDIFVNDIVQIAEYLGLIFTSLDESERTYILLKKMIEKYDETGKDFSKSCFFDIENEDEVNGLCVIASCFPKKLLFFIFKEMLFMAEGDRNAIFNIELLLQLLHETGTGKANLEIDTQTTTYVKLQRKVAKIFDKHTVAVESNHNDTDTIRQVINHLLEGNIKAFCKQFEQCTPQAISEYLGQLFPEAHKPRKQQKGYLQPKEISKYGSYGISSNDLSSNFLTNKNQHN